MVGAARFALLEFAFKVVEVADQEALLLQEVDEHQAAEQDGGIPFAVEEAIHAADVLDELLALGAEVAVEALVDLLDVQGAEFLQDGGQGDVAVLAQLSDVHVQPDQLVQHQLDGLFYAEEVLIKDGLLGVFVHHGDQALRGSRVR